MEAPEIEFRLLRRTDFPLLVEWFCQPAVARWWNDRGTPEAVEAKYGPRVDGLSATTMWIVEVGGEPAGLLQHYRHRDYPDHDRVVGVANAAGIDYLLADSHAGRGLGPIVLARFAAHVFDLLPDVERCVATPAQENRPSWRALEKAGFERLGECQAPDEPPGFAYGLRRSELGR